MPYGIEDPSTYTTKRTSRIILHDVPGSCCVCPRVDVKLGPAFLESKYGLLVAFVCQACYVKHRRDLTMTYEELLLQPTRRQSIRKRKVHAAKPSDLARADKISCDLPQDLEQTREIIQSTVDELEIEASDHAPSAEIEIEASELVQEQEFSVSELVQVQEFSVSELSPRHRVTVSELLPEDDDLEAGMSPEQRARMDQAVARAKSFDGQVMEATHDW